MRRRGGAAAPDSGLHTCALPHRWILALSASVKKWLPLHQALQDFMSQPPEETRM